MKVKVQQVNDALRQLAEEYAEGQLSPAAYRARRRELVCRVTGELPPQLDEGEATHPGLPPVSGEPGAPDQTSPGPVVDVAPPVRRYRVVTLLVLALAMAGAAGLLWFVFRK